MNNDDNIKLQSPLRYPGGKRFLCKYVEQFLRHNQLKPHIFVEPFAGGASVALHLLGRGLVDNIALYDRDPMVSSFWWAVFKDGHWLRTRVQRASVTLEQWERLKDIPLNGHRNNSWKCLFLNRTSFSGILTDTAGPLGGKKQTSDFSIDCRFYRETTIQRLKDLWNYREQVKEIDTADWTQTVQKYTGQSGDDRNNCLIYLDPPFFHKAEGLYNFYFSYDDHERLIRTISKLKTPWLLSYDYCKESVSLFRKYKLNYRSVPVRYTSSSLPSRAMKKEIIASNLLLPRWE